jgi:hypothetical protein
MSPWVNILALRWNCPADGKYDQFFANLVRLTGLHLAWHRCIHDDIFFLPFMHSSWLSDLSKTNSALGGKGWITKRESSCPCPTVGWTFLNYQIHKAHLADAGSISDWLSSGSRNPHGEIRLSDKRLYMIVSPWRNYFPETSYILPCLVFLRNTSSSLTGRHQNDCASLDEAGTMWDRAVVDFQAETACTQT